MRALWIGCLLLPLVAQAPLRPTRHATLPPLSSPVDVAVGDLDGDSDLDLLVANGAAAEQLLRNDGRGRFTDDSSTALPPAAAPAAVAIALADIDGDQDLDALIGCGNGQRNRVLQNDGTGHFTDVSTTSLPWLGQSTRGQAVGDFDGDGDVDWFTVDTPDCHLYRNDGSGVFTDASLTHLHDLPTGLGDPAQQVQAGDVDGDGDLDLLVPNPGGMPTLLENQGLGHFGTFPIPLPAVVGACLHNQFVDLDGDGDLDLLLDRTRIVLRNQGSGTFSNVTATAFAAVHQQTTAVLDLDGDGDPDILSPNVLWRNDGTGQFVGTAIPATPVLHPLGLHPADFDSDGDLDIPPRMNFQTQLDAPTAPALGQPYALDCHVRAGAVSWVVVFGALAGIQVPIPPFGVLRLDQSSMVTLAVQQVGSLPLRLAWTLPNDPAFRGVALHYQAYLEDPRRPGGLGNAILDVVQ